MRVCLASEARGGGPGARGRLWQAEGHRGPPGVVRGIDGVAARESSGRVRVLHVLADGVALAGLVRYGELRRAKAFPLPW